MQPNSNYVSVLFVNLLQPIFDLFELLEQSDPKGPNEVQAGMLENGYAVSVIVLSALVVESALNRTRYVRNEPKRESAVDTLKRLGACDLAYDIEEVFVLRDIIAHNHIWAAVMRWDHSSGMALDSAEKLSAYGDDKFNRVVDSGTRATRRLHLDAFPTRIHRATGTTVLKKAVEALKFLERLDRRYVYLSQPWHVTRGNKIVPFYKWVDGLWYHKAPRLIANEKTTRRHFGIRPHVAAYCRILLRRLDSLGFSGCDSYYVRTSQPRKRWLVLRKGTLTPSAKTK